MKDVIFYARTDAKSYGVDQFRALFTQAVAAVRFATGKRVDRLVISGPPELIDHLFEQRLSGKDFADLGLQIEIDRTLLCVRIESDVNAAELYHKGLPRVEAQQ